MRQREPLVVEHEPVDVDEVEVERAVAPVLGAHPAVLELDALQQLEQGMRLERRLDDDDAVQVARGVDVDAGVLDGGRLVDGRHRDEVDPGVSAISRTAAAIVASRSPRFARTR